MACLKALAAKALAVPVIFWVMLSLLPVLPARADEPLEAFLNKVEQQAAQMGAFSCDFKQIKQLAIFARPVEFAGRLALARPDRLRWEFTRPIPSVLIFNGKQGIRCNGEQEPRVFDLDADPVMRAVAKQLWGWLGGRYLEMRDQYQMELAGENILRLVPQDQATLRFVSEIIVEFTADTLQPTKTEIHQPGGDRTTLLFSNYQLDPVLDPTFFSSCGGRTP